MVDKQVATAIGSLAAARADILTSLRALEIISQGPSSTTIRAIPDGLAQATINLLTSLRQTTTTLSLAFKPPLTAAGITKYLEKATDEVGRLVSCVVAAAAGNSKSVLVDEWRKGVEHVGHELERLLAVLEEGVRAGVSVGEGSAAESTYLAHTGMVWEAIDLLKDNLPTDEKSAVVMRWEGQKGTMRDAWDEFKEMLEDADEDDGPDEFAMDEDDEWAELDKAMNASMSANEKKRAETAKSLLGLHQILHTTIPRFMPLLRLEPDESYLGLLQGGSDLVAAFDVAVSSLYPKQDVAEITESMEALNAQGRALVAAFASRLENGVVWAGKDVAASFADRWGAKLDDEMKIWEEKKLNLGELARALE